VIDRNIMCHKEIIIKRFMFEGIEEANVFVAACVITKKAVLIDAGGFNGQVEKFINVNNLNLTHFFITHGHYDHTGKCCEVVRQFKNLIIIAGSKSSVPFKCYIPEDNDVFQLGNLSGRIHRIPGHTDDMIVLYLSGHLFTGDTLFAGSVGGTSNNTNYDLQISGIQNKLCDYPAETVIHPGHGPDSTLELEKLFNPFLICK